MSIYSQVEKTMIEGAFYYEADLLPAKIKQITKGLAEIAFSLMFNVKRKIVEAKKQVHNGGWGTWSPFEYCGSEISDSVVGNTKGFKVHHYFNDGEGISFDVHKSKPRKAVVVYRNLQVEDYR